MDRDRSSLSLSLSLSLSPLDLLLDGRRIERRAGVGMLPQRVRHRLLQRGLIPFRLLIPILFVRQLDRVGRKLGSWRKVGVFGRLRSWVLFGRWWMRDRGWLHRRRVVALAIALA